MAEEKVKKEEPEGEEYVFTGKRHLHEGKALSQGDVVRLNDDQVKAFGDKFRRKDLPPKATPPGSGGPVIAQTSSIPQDIGAATPNPNMERVNPDNRVGMTPGQPLAQNAPSPMIVPATKEGEATKVPDPEVTAGKTEKDSKDKK